MEEVALDLGAEAGRHAGVNRDVARPGTDDEVAVLTLGPLFVQVFLKGVGVFPGAEHQFPFLVSVPRMVSQGCHGASLTAGKASLHPDTEKKKLLLLYSKG